MAPGGQRMVAPALPRTTRGRIDQRNPFAGPPAASSPLLFFLLALLLGAEGTSLETNDVFLLLPASSASPTNAASSTTEPSGVPETPPPPPRRAAAAAGSPRDEGGRRLLVLRPAADIRCYCNLPRCVTTGYMCKSASGVCFSDLADRTDVELATHGCIELLPSSRQGVCHTTTTTGKNLPNSPHPSPNCSPNCREKSRGSAAVEKSTKVTASSVNSTEGSTPPPDAPLFNHKGQVVVMLLCCHSDMCNHVDSPEIRLRLTNDSLFVGSSSLGMQQGTSVENGESAGSPALYFGSGHDGWFRVATIAVPICGAIILMLLIFVAFKILRRDSEDQKLRGGGSQRHKQHWRSPSQAWDEEDLCLHHQCANTQSHLLPPHGDLPEDSTHHVGHAKVTPNLHASIPLNTKVHLLSPQQRVEADSAVKKYPKLDYFFLFPRGGKCRKQEMGSKKEVPISEETLKAEGPTAVVVVSVQGVREQM